jgi:MFS family permease
VKDFASIVRTRDVGLLLSGRFVSSVGDWLYQVALSLAVYNFSGGNAFFVGLLWIVRLVPSVIAGPYSGALADRLGYRRAMIGADVGRLVVVGSLALVLGGHNWALVYPFALLNTLLGGLFRPASVGIIPSLVESPQQRLAANASVMQIESLAGIFGSAIGGAVAAHSITAALLIDAVSFAGSAGSLLLIRHGAPKAAASAEEADEEAAGGLIAGLRLLGTRPLLIFALAVMALPELASGADLVWIVPFSEKALGQGDAWIGYLFSALAAGALIGGFVAAFIGGSIRLDQMLAVSVFVGGAALVGFGVSGGLHLAALALAVVFVIGLAETVEFTAYETLLQQAVPENMIGRAAGTIDSVFLGMMLIGTAISGLLASWVGVVPSMIGLGALILVSTVASWVYIRAWTAGRPSAARLAEIPAFSGVPESVREWAVRRMERQSARSGAVIIRQGEAGDTFFTIAKGRVRVDIDQDGRRTTRELGPGDVFGEIALLQRVPRTATISAIGRVVVWGMSREDFEELCSRAAEFNDSLWEIAAARLSSSTDFKMALAARP